MWQNEMELYRLSVQTSILNTQFTLRLLTRNAASLIFLNSYTRSSENGGKCFTAGLATRQNSAAIHQSALSQKAKRRLKPFSDDVLTILLPYNRVAAKAHK